MFAKLTRECVLKFLTDVHEMSLIKKKKKKKKRKVRRLNTGYSFTFTDKGNALSNTMNFICSQSVNDFIVDLNASS